MNIYDEGKRRLSSILLWRESKEYQSLCSKRRTDCERLISIGKECLQIIWDSDAEILGSAVKVEYATGGDIHRGFYCPSPVWDIVIGNLHRGRILKRTTVRSKINHRFGFDARNNLVYAETLDDDSEVLSTEYLFVRDNCRIGITINSNRDLESISEEVFEDQKIVHYSYLNVYPDNSGYFCANLHVETYAYDEYGLSSCKKEEFQPYVNVLHIYQYEFTRKNGYLSTYTAKDFPIEGTEVCQVDSPVYLVKIKRKA